MLTRTYMGLAIGRYPTRRKISTPDYIGTGYSHNHTSSQSHVLYVLFCILVYVLFYFYFTIAYLCVRVCVFYVFLYGPLCLI